VTSRPIAVRVAGDAATIDTFVTPGTPLAVFTSDWAQRCSSQPPAELLLVCTDTGRVVDPADTVSTIDGLSGLATGFELLTTAQLEARQRPAAAAPPPAAPRRRLPLRRRLLRAPSGHCGRFGRSLTWTAAR